jgi:hypothetical protein
MGDIHFDHNHITQIQNQVIYTKKFRIVKTKFYTSEKESPYHPQVHFAQKPFKSLTPNVC